MRHSQKTQFHIPHSRILEWNWNVDFHSTFHIPMHFSRVRNDRFSKNTIPHSTFRNSGVGIGTIPHSTFHNSGIEIGMRNFPFHIPHSNTLQHGWSEIFSKGQFHIPHSKILEWELDCGIFHSTFHIPMHFSMVGVRCSQKDNSTFHIPKFWNGNWNVDVVRGSHLAIGGHLHFLHRFDSGCCLELSSNTSWSRDEMSTWKHPQVLMFESRIAQWHLIFFKCNGGNICDWTCSNSEISWRTVSKDIQWFQHLFIFSSFHYENLATNWICDWPHHTLGSDHTRWVRTIKV